MISTLGPFAALHSLMHKVMHSLDAIETNIALIEPRIAPTDPDDCPYWMKSIQLQLHPPSHPNRSVIIYLCIQWFIIEWSSSSSGYVT